MIYEGIDRWNSPSLEHHGVKGMKWGVRHDNPNYSFKQRRRDKAIYGSGGVKRINKRMNKGDSISAARSKEADRIYNTRRIATRVGQVGSIVGGVGGAIAGFYAANQVLKQYGTGDVSTDMLVKSVVSSGAFKVSQTLARSGGQSLAMIIGGYSPSKFRYQ